LTRGPKAGAENTPEAQKIQESRFAHIGKMARMGKLFAAGPILRPLPTGDGAAVYAAFFFSVTRSLLPAYGKLVEPKV